MEEDIEILKEIIEIYMDCGVDGYPSMVVDFSLSLIEIKALENILNRLEQLEKENKELKTNQCDHNISNECIRKSVIRDKIEELKNKYNQRMENKSSLYFTYSKEYGHIEVLKEILGEE